MAGAFQSLISNIIIIKEQMLKAGTKQKCVTKYVLDGQSISKLCEPQCHKRDCSRIFKNFTVHSAESADT